MAVVVHNKKIVLNQEGTDFILVTVNFDEETKQVIAFSVAQFFKENDRMHEIIRYDTAHGTLHAHLYYNLKIKKKIFPELLIESKSYYFCRKDIKENWQKYKILYIRNHLKQRV